MRKNLVGYLFISPWLIGFVLFTLFPFVASIYLSFTQYDIISPPKWVGFANYVEIATTDDRFWTSVGNTLFYALISVPLGLIAAFVLALLLAVEFRGIRIFRTIMFLPSIVPIVALAVLFTWVLNPQLGIVNGFLALFGIEGPAWLLDSEWAMWSLILMSLWGIGNAMIINLAGLKEVPSTLYEAAKLDGANAWQRMRHVTIPMMTPIIFFNLIMGIIYSFQYFTQAYIMTGGGPEDATLFYALYIFERAWQYLDMGYASAMAWILFVIVMVVTGIVFKTHHKWVHYEGDKN
jgi:multiple sugar transport system permease protein